MNKKQWLILVWFCGIVGFFLINTIVFFAMIFEENHKITVYEPREFVFWTEIVCIVFIMITTIWLLYNYLTRKGYLDLIERK